MMFPLASIPLFPRVHCRYHSAFEFVDVFPEYDQTILTTYAHICIEMGQIPISEKIAK